jgi:hypothetical protein
MDHLCPQPLTTRQDNGDGRRRRRRRRTTTDDDSRPRADDDGDGDDGRWDSLLIELSTNEVNLLLCRVLKRFSAF